MVDKHRCAAVGDRQDMVLIRPMTFAAIQQRAAALLVLLARLGVDALDQFQALVLVTDGAHLPRRFACAAKTVLFGVRFVDLRGLVVAAVAIVAVDALLPMDVFGEAVAGDVQPLVLGIPQIGIAVALDAEVFVGSNVRTGPRRQRRRLGGRRPLGRLGSRGFRCASAFAGFAASWPMPTVGRTSSTRMGRSVLMLAVSKETAHGRCGYSLSYFGCSLCPLVIWQDTQMFRGRIL